MLGVPLPHLCWAESVVTTTPGPSTAISELGIRILGSARLPQPSVFKEQPPHLGSLVELTDDTSPNSISKALSILLLRHFQAPPGPARAPPPHPTPAAGAPADTPPEGGAGTATAGRGEGGERRAGGGVGRNGERERSAGTTGTAGRAPPG